MGPEALGLPGKQRSQTKATAGARGPRQPLQARRCGPRWGTRRAGRGGPAEAGGARPAGTGPPVCAYPFCPREIRGRRCTVLRTPNKDAASKPSARLGRVNCATVQGLQTGSPRANVAHMLVCGALGVWSKGTRSPPGGERPSSPRLPPPPGDVGPRDYAGVSLGILY